MQLIIIIFIDFEQMSTHSNPSSQSFRKIWTEQQDQTITEIIMDRKITKWSLVAKIMEQEYNMPGRTGKQCRQRWHNQLDPNIKNEKWSDREQQLLYQYHNEYGNKWAKISIHIPGRTDNCVKNHFYSNLRKALRRINLFILQKRLPGEFRQIRPSILPKVIAVAEEKFDTKADKAPLINTQIIQKCVEVKNKLVAYCKTFEIQEKDVPVLSKLVNDINQLSQIFKHSKVSKLKASQGNFQNLNKKQKIFELKIQPVQQSSQAQPQKSEQPAPPVLMEDDSESSSMNQPIGLDIKNIQGMELDSPTLPGLRLKKKRSSRAPQLFDAQPLDPHDAVLKLLNHAGVADEHTI